jgi:ubiquinone/menaquinone biosynthesis C-methylase UbiE
VHTRDPRGVETAAIAAVVDFDGKRVIEVGCGTGRLTAFAAKHASYVYAFDPDQAALATARQAVSGEAARRVSFGVRSAEALDVERARFDLALCGWSL